MNEREHKLIIKIIERVSIQLQVIKYYYKQAYVSKFDNLNYLRKTQSIKTHIRKYR